MKTANRLFWPAAVVAVVALGMTLQSWRQWPDRQHAFDAKREALTRLAAIQDSRSGLDAAVSDWRARTDASLDSLGELKAGWPAAEKVDVRMRADQEVGPGLVLRQAEVGADGIGVADALALVSAVDAKALSWRIHDLSLEAANGAAGGARLSLLLETIAARSR